MIYVMSDIHGKYDKYISMLDKIDFSNDDTLYVLGDVVDRGEQGINILLDMIKRDNVVPLMGNHDWTMFTLIKNQKTLIDKIGYEKVAELYRLWFLDGGKPTYEAFKKLDKLQRKQILDYISTMDFLKKVDINGKQYYLSHTIPELESGTDFDNLPADNFIHGEPDYDKVYFNDVILITGHTPTELIGIEYKNKIYKKNNHIAIDCGCGFDGSLGCIRLDDEKEFYV